MQIIKLAIISVIVFGLMLLAFTFIMPSHVRISRATDIHASTRKVERALTELKKADTTFSYQYTIIPFDTVTTVQLFYDFHLKWYRPWQKLGSIVYDKQLGPSMEKTLLEIKIKAEH